MSKLSTEQRNQLTDSDFGIPEKRMYPLHDKAHVESAVKLFGHAETKYKKSLARKILSRAREYGMDTSGWKQVLTFAQEQVPPMSNGTSIGNSPPRLMAPYYDEQDELLERVNDLDGAVDPFVFAKRIVSAIHDQVEKDSKPPTGNQNCQLCTWCAEAWYRNMQVLPRPVYSPRDPALEIKGETIVANPIKKRFSSQREVVETVRGNIDSRWYVHVNWKDSTGGHEFLVVNIKDYAYIMDAQAGLLKEIDETDSTNSYFRDINFDNSYMVRLDDKPFNTRLFNEMNDPSKVLPWKNALDIPYMRDNGMINDSSDDDPRFRRVMVPSDEATKYMKQDPELSQYWEELNKATTGEFLVDRETGEPIGHVFVHTNAKDKGFIFNLEVTPKYRRQGYGWILTDDAVRRLGGEDLTVDADNIPAINLYKQYGFEVYEKGQWHYDPPKDELWMKYDRSKLTQESFMDEYEKRVNDKGDPVPYKCKCGGKISITLKGEPIYSCESCGKYYGTVPCNIQEGDMPKHDNTLIPVKDFPYDTVYRGSYDGHIDTNPLYVTPFKGLASIFAARDAIRPKLRELGLRVYNMDYDEWKLKPSELMKPFTTVHVKIQSKEGKTFEPFEIEATGDVYTFDVSNLKDKIYRYNWMNPDKEALVVDYGEIQMPKAERVTVKYIVEPDASFTQEGAFQDLKNGVNPYSDDLVFHVSPDKHIDGQVWQPRVPDYLDPYNPEDTGFEDNTTPRICFSTSIEGALNGITVNLQRQSPDTFDKMYVYVPEKPWKEYKHKTNKQLVKDKLVYDANVTREVWIMEPVRMKLYGVIRVDQIADAKRKAVVPTSKGQKDKRNYFTYKWHWVVKPKVLKKATKFDYSPERVIDDLCVDVKKFKYGLIKDGRLMTGNVSDADYDKYWVFHSGETVDQAGGGNCYDMVEYEAGYLEAFGVPYKKYYMNFTDTKNTKTINTHTICVVPHNGKFIYIEQAFKRIVDEWGYERKKVFDKLTDIFEYVAEVTAEYENQDLNYGVWDYTNAEIDYGTPIKNFMEWIMSKCKMIHDGEATKLKPTEESYEMYDYDDDDIIEESAMDMFIELGDMMFYVSEYHNALFDDPDAHDDVINEYGILLDSYGDEFIEETAKPYDDYLRKHGYDPKTNSIEDPNNPGRRVNAGRIGSKKERNRMNKFLRENGYDPKTETILTDINDKNNPGQKKRVKFGINSAIGNAGARMTMPPAYSRVDDVDDYTDDTESGIAMSKSTMQQKPGQSNYILKHEEGHMAYEDSFDKKRNGTWNNNPSHHSPKAYRDDINAARQHIKSQAKKNPALLGNSHDILPTEYQADKYGEEHNRYGRGHGAAALSNVIGKLKKFDPSTYQAQRKAMLDAYGTGEEGFKKFAASLQDNYDMMLSMAEMMKGTPSASAYKKGLVGIKREIDAGFPESRKVFFSLTQPDEKKAIDEGIQRDIDKMDAGTNSRIAFMKKYADKAQVQQAAADAKRRQLAKEQLKQQIASGKLTGDQAAKAERKIQRIEAFEAGKQQMQQPPKQQTQPQPKQDTISVGKQSISKPTVKKEGYRMNRFGRFYTEAKNEEELLSDDMEDITIGDLELDGDESDDTKDEKISIKDTNIDDDGSLPEEGDFDQYRDDDDDERIEKARGPIDDVPEYLKDRLSDDDLKDFEQPDENLNADNVDLGQFGTDQSDVQNDYDPKEVTILMKLMASEADAMNEYMDGAKETNVDVLRRLYADIANEERFHMEQLLFAKCELTGEQYQPKDPEVKSEYEELLKMGMDEETAMQTAVDKCHIRGSISEDDEDERMEIQADVETMEMTINMFNQLYDNVYTVMESGTPKEVDHAFEIFVEATYDATAASSAKSALSETKKFGPIQLIRTTLRFLVKTLMTIVRKFVSLCKRIHNRSREIKRFIKQYGFEAIFASKIKMYFVNFNNPYLVDDSLETLLALSVDTVNASLRSAGFAEMQQPYKRNPQMNIGGNVKRGIELLNGVQLVKSAMILPENEADRERIAEAFFGYSDQKGPDGKSVNTVNRMQWICDEWCRFMEYVDKITAQFDSLAQQQQSIYYTNKAKYDTAMKGLETVTKTCKAVVSAMQYDIETMIKLNNDAATQAANMADTAAKDDQYNKQKQAYEQSQLVTTQCPFCGKTIKGQPNLVNQELMKHVKTSHADIPDAEWALNNMRKKNKS